MKKRQYWKGIALLFVWATICLAALRTAHGQAAPFPEGNALNRGETSVANICEGTAAPTPVKDALRLVCLRKRPATADFAIRKAIIIGFVGGFVKHDDSKHPEVQFA